MNFLSHLLSKAKLFFLSLYFYQKSIQKPIQLNKQKERKMFLQFFFVIFYVCSQFVTASGFQQVWKSSFIEFRTSMSSLEMLKLRMLKFSAM